MWEKALETETPVTQALVHGLIEGNDYLFRVIAVNKAGQSEPGEASKTFTAKPRFCKLCKICCYLYRWTYNKIYRNILLLITMALISWRLHIPSAPSIEIEIINSISSSF